MVILRRELRKELENAVTAARDAGAKGARKAIEALAVQNRKPWPTMSEEQKQLRNKLRAHGRQLGDVRNQSHGEQTIEHLVHECAYEQWHRMLFARFLAECDLLIEPESGVAISLDECRELAVERSVDWLTLASEFAMKMLSQIFRAGDPVLEVILPPETRQELEGLMKSLPREVFLADDSLGWVYQFWQAEKKREVNDSGVKIGADELAPVTQLFTEDYMVLFLLHNTLGAWWAGKVLAQQRELAKTAKDEAELRVACAIGNVSWDYLRFVRDGEGSWRPAAGTFDGWPELVKDLKVLDPCMGSGHFLVFALPILVGLRMTEEKLSWEAAADAVLSENLFGLELDKRCTQIAAFNLALTVWRMTGHRALPPFNLACSGLGINAQEEEWVELAGKDQRVRAGMSELYRLFKRGPVLGSLINPLALNRPLPLLISEFHALEPLLQAALQREEIHDYEAAEMAIAAKGMAKAGEILASKFTLVTTNVPYLGRPKQDTALKDYCESAHAQAKADLATCFLERCLDFCDAGSTTALVTPQNWLFLGAYKVMRNRLLQDVTWNFVARLGEHAFESAQAAGAFAALVCATRMSPIDAHEFGAWDASTVSGPTEKASVLLAAPVRGVSQKQQLLSPDSRFTFEGFASDLPLLSRFADSYQGLRAGDRERFVREHWEVNTDNKAWEPLRGSTERRESFDGLTSVILWEGGNGTLAQYAALTRNQLHDMHESGNLAWGRKGIALNHMRELLPAFYSGEKFDGNIGVVVPKDRKDFEAIAAFCTSKEYNRAVRALDQKISVTNATLIKVPFDLAHWQDVAAQKYPAGVPRPHSEDPKQWLFEGHPRIAEKPLQVAVARLLAYRWPRQNGSNFTDCPALSADGLEKFADADGIVCLDALQGELPAADRLRVLLAAAYGKEWSSSKQNELLDQVGAVSLDGWLREKFFEQHCTLFQNRPFVWHVWDGLKSGFHALVNYHNLAAPNGQGHRTLEKLIYSYVGDWIRQQRDDQKNGVEGADVRVAAAEHLKKKLEQILQGEPPYDVFVRWKPLHEQPIGWQPDINDGVRVNIRPFLTAKPLEPRTNNSCILRVTPKVKWEKDKGKEPIREKDDFPWFWSWDQSADTDFPGNQKFDGNRWNNLHYSNKFKQESRDRNSILKRATKR